MSTSVSFPFKTLPNSGSTCKWFAGHNPLIVTIQRKDYTVTGTDNDGTGKVKITTAAAISETLTIGGYIYVSSGAVKGKYAILSNPSSSEIVVDLAFVATTSGGFVNLNTDRVNYKMRVYVKKYDRNEAAFLPFSEAIFTPDSTGLILADLESYVSHGTRALDQFDLSVVNQRDDNLTALFDAFFQEEWYGNTPSTLIDVTFQTINAAMQNLNKYGSNIVKYMTEPTGQDLAKFITGFTRPTYWVGLPFDLQFLLSELFVISPPASGLKVVEVVTNANGSQSTVQHTIDNTQVGGVNRVRMSGYSGAAVKTELRITTGDLSTSFTETITIDIIQCLPKNPVLLKWHTTEGGWDYYCFGVSQINGIDRKAGGIFEQFEDLESKSGSGRLQSLQANPTIEMGAEMLTEEKLIGLEGLNRTIEAELFMGLDENDAPIWNTVIVSKIDTKYDTKLSRHKMSVVIELPDFNIQTQ